jgi:hypothetical protein
MNELWGIYTIDRFANSTNAKLSRFNSLFWNVNTEAVDGFTYEWYDQCFEKINGQQAAEVHFGIIRVPLALHATKSLTVLITA